jgi:hypothetical protein
LGQTTKVFGLAFRQPRWQWREGFSKSSERRDLLHLRKRTEGNGRASLDTRRVGQGSHERLAVVSVVFLEELPNLFLELIALKLR